MDVMRLLRENVGAVGHAQIRVGNVTVILHRFYAYKIEEEWRVIAPLRDDDPENSVVVYLGADEEKVKEYLPHLIRCKNGAGIIKYFLPWINAKNVDHAYVEMYYGTSIELTYVSDTKIIRASRGRVYRWRKVPYDEGLYDIYIPEGCSVDVDPLSVWSVKDLPKCVKKRLVLRVPGSRSRGCLKLIKAPMVDTLGKSVNSVGYMYGDYLFIISPSRGYLMSTDGFEVFLDGRREVLSILYHARDKTSLENTFACYL